MIRSPQFLRVLFLGLLCAAISCSRIEQVVESILDDRTPRQRYVDRLDSAGLGGTALARDWKAAAERALHEAPTVTSPYSEVGFLHSSEPEALAFRVSMRRGQRAEFTLILDGDSSALVFLDAFEVGRGAEDSLEELAVADSGERRINIGPRRDGEFIFRAQPELLRGGRFSLSLQITPSLAFPVQGGRESDIGSVFGDPRDGGVRGHHGIDIFAARGTPAIAAAAGTVRRVETTPVGGNVVWLNDEFGNRLYYAHLDRFIVRNGQRIEIGDTLGFVGNTGNARTTPPHLHFGVYSRGPVDPYWFVHRPRAALPGLLADTTLLGRWVRLAAGGATLLSAPDNRSAAVAELDASTAVRVLGAYGDWYRVRLPIGASGYLPARTTHDAATALREGAAPEGALLLTRPVELPSASEVLAQLGENESVEILGEFGAHLLVRSSSGLAGWLLSSSTSASSPQSR